jgi:replication factor C subunit 2/4
MDDFSSANVLRCYEFCPPHSPRRHQCTPSREQLLGDDHYQSAVLERNASDARGIDVVRNKIKAFCQSKRTQLPPNRHKIVILDEADSMTTAARQAMRRTMESVFQNVLVSHWRAIVRLRLSNPSNRERPFYATRNCPMIKYCPDCASSVKRKRSAYDVDGLEALLFTAEGDLTRAQQLASYC